MEVFKSTIYMRTEAEIKKALSIIRQNKEVTFGYKEDVINVLLWALGGDVFDGIEEDDLVKMTGDNKKG